MFVGHYSAAFVAKAFEPRVPLWVLLLAAQLVDVLWAPFVLVGIEGVRIDPSLPSNPLDLHHMPYTHSLVGAGLWACLAGWLVARSARLGGTNRAGIAVALVVVSHWLLDLLVHRPDLTLWGAPPRLGLGLWDLPLAAYLLELGLVAGAAWLYAVRSGVLSAGLGLLVGLLFVLQSWVALGPAPTSIPLLMLSVLAVFVAVAYAGSRTERRAKPAAA